MPGTEAKQERNDARESEPKAARKEPEGRAQSAAMPKSMQERTSKDSRPPIDSEVPPRLGRRDAVHAPRNEGQTTPAASARPQANVNVIDQRPKDIEKMMNNKESVESKETDGLRSVYSKASKASKTSKRGSKKKGRKMKKKGKGRRNSKQS